MLIVIPFLHHLDQVGAVMKSGDVVADNYFSSGQVFHDLMIVSAFALVFFYIITDQEGMHPFQLAAKHRRFYGAMKNHILIRLQFFYKAQGLLIGIAAQVFVFGLIAAPEFKDHLRIITDDGQQYFPVDIGPQPVTALLFC